MELGPTPPIISESLEPPEPKAWLYETLDKKSEVLRRKTPDAQLEEYRHRVQPIWESPLFGWGDVESYANDAVHAEQDMVTVRVDKCAEMLIAEVQSTNDGQAVTNQLLDELAALRLFVNRGRSGQGYFDKPNWWNRNDDIDPALMLMRSARTRR